VAVFVECTTDNLNRTVSNVRAIFSKYGGNMGKKGEVEFMFARKSVFTLEAPEGLDQDEFMLELIDAGAEDVEIEEGYVHITGTMENFGSLQNKLDNINIEPESAELQRIPTTMVELDNDAVLKVMKLIEMLEDDDDVAKVYHNMEISEDQMELI
jgi:YebC/PmpR family DNA-binding regulatory protein